MNKIIIAHKKGESQMFNYASYYRNLNNFKRCQSAYDNMVPPDYWDEDDDREDDENFPRDDELEYWGED